MRGALGLLLEAPFHQKENKESERLSYLSKITQLENGRAETGILIFRILELRVCGSGQEEGSVWIPMDRWS